LNESRRDERKATTQSAFPSGFQAVQLFHSSFPRDVTNNLYSAAANTPEWHRDLAILIGERESEKHGKYGI
jgi:hypothetical protein